MQSFLQLSEGGVVPNVLPAARRVFGRMLDEAAQNPDPEAAAWVRRMHSPAHAEEAEAGSLLEGWVLLDGRAHPMAQ